METTRKNLSDTKVLLTITVSKKDLVAAEQAALKTLSRTVKVAGFRAGKVPAGVAAKHVDPAALQDESLNNALNNAVTEAFITEKIQPLDRPSVEVQKFVPGELLEFTAEVEIVPKVKLGDYKHLKAKQEPAKVTDIDVEEIIERMRTGFATREEVDRGAKVGDEILMDFVGKKEDVAFDGGTAKDYTLAIGSGQFIPGFEEGIVGHKAGEEFDIDLDFPADYHAKELAGTKVVFSVTLKKVLEPKLPEVDNDFAAKAGPFKTVAELKADITREISSQKDREAHEKYKDALITELVEKSTVPTPDILVEDHMRSIEQDFERNLAYQGLNLDSYFVTNKFKDADDWRDKEVRPTATRRVQAGLVLAELTSAENVKATDAEVDEHVEVHKKQYANNEDALKQFETAEVRRDIANHFLTEKTIEHLITLNGGTASHSH